MTAPARPFLLGSLGRSDWWQLPLFPQLGVRCRAKESERWLPRQPVTFGFVFDSGDTTAGLEASNRPKLSESCQGYTSAHPSSTRSANGGFFHLRSGRALAKVCGTMGKSRRCQRVADAAVKLSEMFRDDAPWR